MKGDEVILLCPKKLEQNWKQYQRTENSIFEDDDFLYKMNLGKPMSKALPIAVAVLLGGAALVPV